jgi:hypothetical protein
MEKLTANLFATLSVSVRNPRSDIKRQRMKARKMLLVPP